MLIASLSTTFNSNVQASQLPSNVKGYVSTKSKAGVEIIPVSQVDAYAQSKGLSSADSSQVAEIYSDSQVDSLRSSLYALIAIAVISLLFSKNIPDKKLG